MNRMTMSNWLSIGATLALLLLLASISRATPLSSPDARKGPGVVLVRL